MKHTNNLVFNLFWLLNVMYETQEEYNVWNAMKRMYLSIYLFIYLDDIWDSWQCLPNFAIYFNQKYIKQHL